MSIGSERDPAVRNFGLLYEGLQADITRTSPMMLNVLRHRYIMRLKLADLARMPEGMEFHLESSQIPPKNMILLSPPELVAVLCPNGSWVRMPRVRVMHGPEPYSRVWYQRYLSDYNLPTYFFQIGHRDMRAHHAEAEALGLTQMSLPRPALVPTSRYLNTRYPVAQRAFNTVGSRNTWVYKLSDEEQHALARRFPATNLLRDDKRVLVLPDGYICVHHEPIDAASAMPPQVPVPWIPNWNVGSYVVSAGYTAENLTANDSIASKYARNMLLQASRANRAILVNPKFIPPGLGVWGWLEEAIDGQLAHILGLNNHEDVVRARYNGGLVRGAGESFFPVPIWYPDPRYLNPEQAPQGVGEWEFLSPEDKARAQAALASISMVSPTEISAAAFWRARVAYKLRTRQGLSTNDITSDVNIVWIPYPARPAYRAPCPLMSSGGESAASPPDSEALSHSAQVSPDQQFVTAAPLLDPFVDNDDDDDLRASARHPLHRDGHQQPMLRGLGSTPIRRPAASNSPSGEPSPSRPTFAELTARLNRRLAAIGSSSSSSGGNGAGGAHASARQQSAPALPPVEQGETTEGPLVPSDDEDDKGGREAKIWW